MYSITIYWKRKFNSYFLHSGEENAVVCQLVYVLPSFSMMDLNSDFTWRRRALDGIKRQLDTVSRAPERIC